MVQWDFFFLNVTWKCLDILELAELFTSDYAELFFVSPSEWNDVVVAREGSPTILVCTDTNRGSVAINWMVKPLGVRQWKLLLSANDRKEFSGGSLKDSMRLSDPEFGESGDFSLFFLPTMEDSGFYLCMIKQAGRTVKEKIILLAILKVTVIPAPPILQYATLRLIATVSPDFAVTKITWAAPGGVSMRSEKHPKFGTVAKLPQVQNSDSGAYVCMVHPWGNSSKALFAFNVDVSVEVASFTNITHGPLISTGTLAHTSFPLTCPAVQGDYVLLYWLPPDSKKQNNMKVVFTYDRWRGSTLLTEQSKRLQLAGPPRHDGGPYICEVFLNDNTFSQRTLLSVLKGNGFTRLLELGCVYSELSQVQSATWKHENQSRRLRMISSGPGSITTVVPLPITSDTAGNYTCTLQLKNGQTVLATHTVTLPPEESVSVTTPSLLPCLSALLLLVPLVAVAVSVLLWRQKHISDRIEQSLSVQSGETENIYENPQDIRQVMNQIVEDDVYKELEAGKQKALHHL
uniref:Ig-like domain-containing protein n=1 Tax=Sphaeramia orbicularis TaxID=375764 RepID=A0A673CAH7_9TELE